MKKSFRIIMLTLLVSLIYVNSSSGISVFDSKREVNMKVVNSSNALIAIPDVINLNIKLLKTRTNYYELAFPENKEAIDLIDKSNLLEINNVLLEKSLIKTDEVFTITDVADNLNIKNNLNTDLYICKISFDNPLLSSNYDSSLILPGDERAFPINIRNEKEINIIEQLDNTTNAEMEFQWNGGNSIIYVNINIIAQVNEEIKDNYINENEIKDILKDTEEGKVA